MNIRFWFYTQAVCLCDWIAEQGRLGAWWFAKRRGPKR